MAFRDGQQVTVNSPYYKGVAFFFALCRRDKNCFVVILSDDSTLVVHSRMIG